MRSSLHCLFLDIKKAYDSVNRAALWRVLAEQLPSSRDIIACVKQLYVDLTAFLKGDPHSPLC